MIHRFDPVDSPSQKSTHDSDFSRFAHWAAPLLLFLVACFALGYYGYAALDTHLFHSRQAGKLDQTPQQSQAANGPGPNAASNASAPTGASDGRANSTAAPGANPRAANSTPRNGNTSGANSPAETVVPAPHRPPSEDLRSEAAAELKGRAPNSVNSDSAGTGGKYSFGPFPKLLPSPPSRDVPAIHSFDKNANSSSTENAYASSAPLGRIEISAIGMKAPILEGAGYRTLQRGIGHISGTASLGHTGNVGLAGDPGTFFRNLRNVHEGDVITLLTSNGAFLYRVDLISITDAENSAVLRNNGENILTLVTSYPFSYPGNAPKRFIVRAKQLPSM